MPNHRWHFKLFGILKWFSINSPTLNYQFTPMLYIPICFLSWLLKWLFSSYILSLKTLWNIIYQNRNLWEGASNVFCVIILSFKYRDLNTCAVVEAVVQNASICIRTVIYLIKFLAHLDPERVCWWTAERKKERKKHYKSKVYPNNPSTISYDFIWWHMTIKIKA